MSDRVAQSEISYDAIVIGGGFYGSAIACYLAGQRGKKTLLIEREPALLRRASFNNRNYSGSREKHGEFQPN